MTSIFNNHFQWKIRSYSVIKYDAIFWKLLLWYLEHMIQPLDAKTNLPMKTLRWKLSVNCKHHIYLMRSVCFEAITVNCFQCKIRLHESLWNGIYYLSWFFLRYFLPYLFKFYEQFIVYFSSCFLIITFSEFDTWIFNHYRTMNSTKEMYLIGLFGVFKLISLNLQLVWIFSARNNTNSYWSIEQSVSFEMCAVCIANEKQILLNCGHSASKPLYRESMKKKKSTESCFKSIASIRSIVKTVQYPELFGFILLSLNENSLVQ